MNETHILRKPIFYGYWVVVAGFFCFFITNGCGYYAFSLFVKPLQAEFAWGRSEIMAAFSIFILVLGILRISLTGNHPPKTVDPKRVNLSEDGLSIAYYLREKNAVPETYVPVVSAMARSESTAQRYWGAYLLGILGDRKFSDTLLKLLEDPSPNVRYTAGRSFYFVLKNESLNTILVRLLGDPNWYVKCKIFSVFLKAGMMPSRL